MISPRNFNPHPITTAAIITIECADSCCDMYSKTVDGKQYEGDVVAYAVCGELEQQLARADKEIERLRLLVQMMDEDAAGECI